MSQGNEGELPISKAKQTRRALGVYSLEPHAGERPSRNTSVSCEAAGLLSPVENEILAVITGTKFKQQLFEKRNRVQSPQRRDVVIAHFRSSVEVVEQSRRSTPHLRADPRLSYSGQPNIIAVEFPADPSELFYPLLSRDIPPTSGLGRFRIDWRQMNDRDEHAVASSCRGYANAISIVDMYEECIEGYFEWANDFEAIMRFGYRNYLAQVSDPEFSASEEVGDPSYFRAFVIAVVADFLGMQRSELASRYFHNNDDETSFLAFVKKDYRWMTSEQELERLVAGEDTEYGDEAFDVMASASVARARWLSWGVPERRCQPPLHPLDFLRLLHAEITGRGIQAAS